MSPIRNAKKIDFLLVSPVITREIYVHYHTNAQVVASAINKCTVIGSLLRFRYMRYMVFISFTMILCLVRRPLDCGGVSSAIQIGNLQFTIYKIYGLSQLDD